MLSTTMHSLGSPIACYRNPDYRRPSLGLGVTKRAHCNVLIRMDSSWLTTRSCHAGWRSLPAVCRSPSSGRGQAKKQVNFTDPVSRTRSRSGDGGLVCRAAASAVWINLAASRLLKQSAHRAKFV